MPAFQQALQSPEGQQPCLADLFADQRQPARGVCRGVGPIRGELGRKCLHARHLAAGQKIAGGPPLWNGENAPLSEETILAELA